MSFCTYLSDGTFRVIFNTAFGISNSFSNAIHHFTSQLEQDRKKHNAIEKCTRTKPAEKNDLLNTATARIEMLNYYSPVLVKGYKTWGGGKDDTSRALFIKIKGQFLNIKREIVYFKI